VAEQDPLVNSIRLCRLLDVLADVASSCDGLRRAPWAPWEAEGVKVRV
jgi:hypothetical protein